MLRIAKKIKGSMPFPTLLTLILVIIIIALVLVLSISMKLTETSEESFGKTEKTEYKESLFKCPGINRQSSYRTLHSESGDLGGTVKNYMSHNLEDLKFKCEVPGTSESGSGCVIESLKRTQRIDDGCDDIMNIGWFEFNFSDPSINFNFDYPCSGSFAKNGIILEESGDDLSNDMDKYTQFISPFSGDVHKSRFIFEVDGETYNWEEATNFENYVIEPIPSEEPQLWHYDSVNKVWELVNITEEGERYALWIYRECKMKVEEDPRICFHNHTYYADIFENMDVMSAFIPVEKRTLINSYFILLEKHEDTFANYCNDSLYNIKIKEKCAMDPLDDYYYCDYNKTNSIFKAGGEFYDWTLEVRGRYCCPEREIKDAEGYVIYDQDSGNPMEEGWQWNSQAMDGKGACCLGIGCMNIPCIEEGGKWMYGECWFEGSPGENCIGVCGSHIRPSGTPYTCKIPDLWQRVPKNCELQEKFGADCSNSCVPDSIAPADLGGGNCKYFDYDLFEIPPVDDYGCGSSVAGGKRFCACE
ncbi:MAG: hypothetical protein JSV92_01040 [archaeon]|nr:MAG: hypothetical protein JSV92_01040 [archaeon]